MSLSSIVCSLLFIIREAMENKLEVWGIIYVRGDGKKKIELFPIEKLLHSVCIFPGKTNGYSFHMNIFKCTVEVLWLKYFVLRIHLDWYERTSKKVWIEEMTVIDPIKLLNVKNQHVLIGDLNFNLYFLLA